MKPTYEDLLSLVKHQSQLIFEQQQTIKRLEKKVADLEEKLNLNSKNSSKSPSSDQKQNRAGPKGGAKRGHIGYFRKLLAQEKVTKVITSSLDACEFCGSENLKKKKPWILQQIELPEIKPLVTQIECERACCQDCCKNLLASLPEGYDASSFGPKLSAFIGLLTSAYRLSKRSCQSLLKTAFGIEISLGVIPAIENRLAEAIKDPYDSLLQTIKESACLYVDETSFREKTKNCFVWTISTKALSLIRILPSRSKLSLQEIWPKGYKGAVVTDRLPIYQFKKHQYCLSHLKRDFERYADKKDEDGSLAKRLLFELREVFAAFRHFSDLKHLRQIVGYRRRRFQNILEEVCLEGSKKFAKLAGKLLNEFEKLFLFTRYRGVEPTNNIAERALRHIVLWRKTSYGTQSANGSKFLERAVSLFMTIKKQGGDVFEFFARAYQSRTNPKLIPT